MLTLPAKQKTTTPPSESPPVVPALEAVGGIRFDFNDGLRVSFPADCADVSCRFIDLDAHQVIGRHDAVPGKSIATTKKYFIRHRLEVTKDGKLVFAHDFSAKGRDVLVRICPGAIGDAIAFFPSVAAFGKKHRCRLHVCMDRRVAAILSGQYPDIVFITPEQAEAGTFYASYRVGLFWGDRDNSCQPVDFRQCSLLEQAANILGVKPLENPPVLDLTAPRLIKERYACVAVQSTSKCKTWCNPLGWLEVVDFLKGSGYRVLCIDKERVYGTGLTHTFMPSGVEDFTGSLPLQERVNLIKDADFMVGLSSGLSWLAWACRVPVVMIGGFSLPMTEFKTPYRVINYNACHGCWNDAACSFDHDDYTWCPRHHGDNRQWECTRLISSLQVINAIRRIPAFRQSQKERKAQ